MEYVLQNLEVGAGWRTVDGIVLDDPEQLAELVYELGDTWRAVAREKAAVRA